MKGCLVAFGIFVGLVAAGIVSCSILYPTIHVRYRVTLEVQDGDEIKTASSVIEVSYTIKPDVFDSLDGPSSHSPIEGYAPTVDLGKKGLLFLTFQNADRMTAQQIERNKMVSCGFDDIPCLPFAAYGSPRVSVDTPYSPNLLKAALYKLLDKSGPRSIPFVTLPRLARLSNINNSATLVTVLPFDLAASFGPGIELKRVTLELTHDPITPAPPIWPKWIEEKDDMVGILKGNGK